jgi:hypothetical protein
VFKECSFRLDRGILRLAAAAEAAFGLVSGGRGIRTHEDGVTALAVFKTAVRHPCPPRSGSARHVSAAYGHCCVPVRPGRIRPVPVGLRPNCGQSHDAPLWTVLSGVASPAAAGDDECLTCRTEQTVRWHGSVGVRETFNVWSCTGCGAVWTTRVRCATADLEPAA